MKSLKLLSLIGLFAVLVTSCNKKSKLGKLIPKEASAVVVIDQKSILSKLPWEEIKKTYWYNQLMSDSSVPATAKTFLSDPSKTGIDMEANLVSFVLNAENGQHVVEGNVKDNKTFADFLKNMHPAGIISKDKDLDVMKTEGAVVAWNNERFVLVANTADRFHDMSSMTDSVMSMIDSVTTNSIKTEAPPRPNADSLLAVCKNIFELTEANSLYENERFAQMESEEGDVHIWMNINELTKGAMKNAPDMIGMIKLNKFMEDNITTLTFNFQDGKVSATYKQYFGKELSDILKNGDGDVNTEMIKRIPSSQVAGIFAFHFTPGNLLEIIKLTGLDGFINLFMAQKGVSLDDVVKATKGDILFAVSDIRMAGDTNNLKSLNDTVSNYYQKPTATILFSLSIGDKDAFNKLLNLGNDMQKDLNDKNTFQKKDDKFFAISNSQEAVNKYISGTSTDHTFLSEIKDYPTGGFVDIQMILKALKQELTKDSMGKVYYDRNITMWNNLYFRGGEYKDGGLVNYAELNFVDGKSNSLKQLNQFLDDNVKIIMEKKKKESEEWKTNTLPPAKVDTVVTKKKPGGKRK